MGAAVILMAAAVPATAVAAEPDAPVVACVSGAGERTTCAAAAGGTVTLVKSTGPVTCARDKTWGVDAAGLWVRDGCSAEFSIGQAAPGPAKSERYTPDAGFTIVDAEQGQLVFRLFATARYLNQRALDDSYVDAFGQTKPVKLRQDIQLNKVIAYFLGWVFNPKFRYLSYVWTSNTSQGLGAQVVVGGNFGYNFNDHVGLYVGIGSLPGTRSTAGNFPYWLGVDDRLIADEFFRPSYTSGTWATGKIVERVNYQAMLGNNLSQLGVDAGQLDNNLDTFSAEVSWLPTTGEFGRRGAFGDLEGHDTPATRLALHFTRSDENRQSQPGTEAIDNVQIRLSDGNIVFTPGLFGPDISITDVVYRMTSIDAGLKYRGMSVEAEFYWRLIDDLRGVNTELLPADSFRDHGFQVQGSMMMMPQTLQAYVSGSRIAGEYGKPWEMRAGINWYPWMNHAVRLNAEQIYLRRSPVGALSLPFTVGGNGPLFVTNLEVYF